MTRTRIATAVAIALAASLIGAVFGQPGNGRAAAQAVPSNTAPPAISGTAQVGQTLTASTGTWTGNPTTFAYAWSRCDSSGNACTAIGGAAAATYKPVADDTGHTLRVAVTATNGDGASAPATSDPTAVVSNPAAPKNTAAPAISGTVQIGSKLTASTGTWTGNPTYTYAWSRCDAKGANCSTIGGATSNTYTLTAADAGTTLRVTVVATNKSGATSATSAATAVVPAATGCPAGTGAIQVADLDQPARLAVDKASITPRLVTLGTHTIQLHVHVTACNGRPVQGAMVFAVPIPYNQFAGKETATGADGMATITEHRLRGFPARGRHQHLLAVFVRARKPGDPLLGGVSTRRTVAFQVHLP